METLYLNIGGKLKKAAVLIAALGILSSIVWAISIWSSRYGEFMSGLLVLALGAIGSYIGSWVMYAFGSMVENIQIIAEAVKNNLAVDSILPSFPMRSEISAPTCGNDGGQMEPTPRPVIKESDYWICKGCGYRNPNTLAFCKDCARSK